MPKLFCAISTMIYRLLQLLKPYKTTFMAILRAIFTDVASTWQASSPIVRRIKKNLTYVDVMPKEKHPLKQSRELLRTILTIKGVDISGFTVEGYKSNPTCV